MVILGVADGGSAEFFFDIYIVANLPENNNNNKQQQKKQKKQQQQQQLTWQITLTKCIATN